MASLTIFSNFYINDTERLQRMKDSFLSFCAIEAELWVINIRGEFKLEALEFLKRKLGHRLIGMTIDSNKGWFHDTRGMINYVKTDYVLYWVEDHINMINSNLYKDIFEDMRVNGVDYLFTSWWRYDQAINHHQKIKPIPSKYLNIYDVNHKSINLIKSVNKNYFIISLCGAFSKELFSRIINSRHPWLRRYPKETPFDFEKRATDTLWLPIITATPNIELFAPIDDDLAGIEGVCLQSRGLYPKREIRNSNLSKSLENSTSHDFKLGFMSKILKKVKNVMRRLYYHF
jgi:hypothetical protein